MREDLFYQSDGEGIDVKIVISVPRFGYAYPHGLILSNERTLAEGQRREAMKPDASSQGRDKNKENHAPTWARASLSPRPTS